VKKEAGRSYRIAGSRGFACQASISGFGRAVEAIYRRTARGLLHPSPKITALRAKFFPPLTTYIYVNLLISKAYWKIAPIFTIDSSTRKYLEGQEGYRG
jgi:hypothetical protein